VIDRIKLVSFSKLNCGRIRGELKIVKRNVGLQMISQYTNTLLLKYSVRPAVPFVSCRCPCGGR